MDLILCDRFHPFRDGGYRQLPRQQEADGTLNLPGGDGLAEGVMYQTRSLEGEALENVWLTSSWHSWSKIFAHGLGGEARGGVDLFQHLVAQPHGGSSLK